MRVEMVDTVLIFSVVTVHEEWRETLGISARSQPLSLQHMAKQAYFVPLNARKLKKRSQNRGTANFYKLVDGKVKLI